MNETVKLAAAAAGGYALGLATRTRRALVLALWLSNKGKRAAKATIDAGAKVLPEGLRARAGAVTGALGLDKEAAGAAKAKEPADTEPAKQQPRRATKAASSKATSTGKSGTKASPSRTTATRKSKS